jgi:hypothetical protein
MCFMIGLLGAISGTVLGLLGAVVYWSIGVFAAGHGWTLGDDQMTALVSLSAIGLGVPGFGLGLFLDFA